MTYKSPGQEYDLVAGNSNVSWIYDHHSDRFTWALADESTQLNTHPRETVTGIDLVSAVTIHHQPCPPEDARLLPDHCRRVGCQAGWEHEQYQTDRAWRSPLIYSVKTLI